MAMKHRNSKQTTGKMTEKQFLRMMTASVFGILLSISCLVSTTWAWFTVDVESDGNEIQIATISADMTVQKDGSTVSKAENGRYLLNEDTYAVTITLTNTATERKAPVYVVISLKQGEANVSKYYLIFDNQSELKKEVTLGISKDSTEVSIYASWAKPDGAVAQLGNDVSVIGEIPTEPSEPQTEGSTEPETSESDEGDDTQETVESDDQETKAEQEDNTGTQGDNQNTDTNGEGDSLEADASNNAANHDDSSQQNQDANTGNAEDPDMTNNTESGQDSDSATPADPVTPESTSVTGEEES